jgi:hypothetical protein
MKTFDKILVFILFIAFLSGCTGKSASKKETQVQGDSITIPDTGYTGIKRYMNGKTLFKEVTFKNGIRNGLMKTFYQTGQVRQTFWYENGLREDSSKWYFQEGQVFRSTPYKKDTIDGIQKQYYRTGRLKAKIGYSKGLRTTYFQEFTSEGKLVSGYPTLVTNFKDEYKSKGIYRILLEISDKSTGVKYYRDNLNNGMFDTAHCEPIKTIKGTGILDLKKTGSPKPAHVSVIAEILTNFGNKYLLYKKIEVPYNDLN